MENPDHEVHRGHWGKFLGGFLLFLLLLVGGFYFIENKRGQDRLNRVEADLRAQGESLNLRDLLPPRVPDEENLAAAPLFLPIWPTLPKGASSQLSDSPEGRTLKGFNLDIENGTVKKPLSGIYQGKPTDLVAWQKYLASTKKFPHPETPGDPAKDVLQALDLFKAPLDQLRIETTNRTHIQFPIDFREGMAMRLPHWIYVQKVVEVACLRSCALLAENRTAEAFADLDLAMHLIPGSNDEPSVICVLSASICRSRARRPLIEGLEHHQWSASQLREIKAQLGLVNSLDHYQRAMRVERVATEQLYTEIRLNPSQAFLAISPVPTASPSLNLFFQLVPRGWLLQNQAIQEDLIQKLAIDTFDSSLQIVKPTVTLESLLKKEPIPYTALARIMSGFYSSVPISVARDQSDVHQAIVACSLELYRLEKGIYPQSLVDLPDASQLPHDVMNGQPMHYSSDGHSFQLYSIGWNRIDDSGKVIFKSSPSTQPDNKQGDWVWPHLQFPK